MKTYPNGCTKALTLSYDDGVYQDERLLGILNEYGIKSTFNLSHGLLDETGHWETEGVIVKRISSQLAKTLYGGHEIACHSLTHPFLPNLSHDEKVQQIVEDKERLEALIHKKVEGMAYPFGGTDDDCIDIMKACGLQYGRIVPSTQTFALPKDLYRWQPTSHHNDETLFELLDTYKALQSDVPTLFYLWGHSYEFDVDQNWDRMRRICEAISGREDIWYCTNIEWVHWHCQNGCC